MSARLLADSPAVLFIVYTPGPGAEERGYEGWLQTVDAPFFNAIPGVHHYANWKIERVLHGPAPGYTHFDFQALTEEADLERVWFNPELDHFRTEWIRLWGYGEGKPHPAQAYAFLMHPAGKARGAATGLARIMAGTGEPPTYADRCWTVDEAIRKHFATGPAGAEWRVPASSHNPLGFDWVAITYGSDPEALAAYDPGAETLAVVARRIAAP